MRFLRTGLGCALAVAVVTLPLSAPGRAAERGETRTLARFDHVRTNGAFTVYVTTGAATQHVTISGDPAAVARVTTRVDAGTLVVGMRSGTSPFARLPVVTIEVPELRGYANEGAGSATLTGLTGGALALSNAGAATIRATGRVRSLSVELDGVGTIDAARLDAGDVSVENNGVGRVDVRANGALSIAVNGVGEVRYAGNPTQVESHVNGIGRIGRL